MTKSRLIPSLFIVALFIMMSACTSVKPYQKMHLYDRDMVLSQKQIMTFESNFQTYREGASGANGGKVGGGCGCN